MRTITLTSDWNGGDYYAGAIKGQLYSYCSDIQVVEITNSIKSFHDSTAGLVLRGCYKYYQEGTIHLICVNTEITADKQPLCVMEKGQFFIACGMAAIRAIFSSRPERIVRIEVFDDDMMNSTFPDFDVIASTAIMLSNGYNIEELGTDITSEIDWRGFMPAFDGERISASIIHIDSYGNIFTNITCETLVNCGFVIENCKLMINKAVGFDVNHVSKLYSNVKSGEMFALVNKLGLIEIGIKHDNLARLINVDINDSVTVVCPDRLNDYIFMTNE
ncbi:MAG: SAM-dependent chlorinase/fluorinase [Salinivirgaceae bacterium]|nr:SAM-dependent chlorinase/fluorinase [Salinivirgaceae bacterium]